MEFYQAAVLSGAVCLIVVLSSRAALPFFLALVLGALFFAILSRMTLPSIGDTFSLGFAQTIDSFGLFIIAGCAVSAFLEKSGARLPARWQNNGGAAVVVGLVASFASATPALALLRPWCRGAGLHDVLILALALSAGQAFIYPSLIVVATRAILKVDLVPALAIGLTLAVATSLIGWLFVRWMTPSQPENQSGGAKLGTMNLGTTIVSVLLPLMILIAATFTQIPSEPFGRWCKEFFVFLSRPTIILVLSLGLSLLMLKRFDKMALSESGWLGGALTASVRPLLAVGAAGGFVSVLQATGMAELIAERISFLSLGIFVPFAAAATLKILQGSPLVATLTAAGMMEPLLAPLGLGSALGHALAASAIGAGTLIAHVNDPLFWLVADVADVPPLRTLTFYTFGTLIQAACAILLLWLLCGLLH
jgi:GntP family gluconate:H+ symporter